MGSAAVPVLIDALHHGGTYARLGAAEALGTIGLEAAAAVPALIEALSDDHRLVRRASAEAIRHIGVIAAPALVEALRDDSSHDSAVDFLGEIGSAGVPILLEALKHGDAHVRRGAAEALGHIAPKAVVAVPALIEALRDASIRREATEALQDLGASAVPALVEAFEDAGLRPHVVRVLGSMRTDAEPSIGALLDKALQDKESEGTVGNE